MDKQIVSEQLRLWIFVFLPFRGIYTQITYQGKPGDFFLISVIDNITVKSECCSLLFYNTTGNVPEIAEEIRLK